VKRVVAVAACGMLFLPLLCHVRTKAYATAQAGGFGAPQTSSMISPGDLGCFEWPGLFEVSLVG